MAADKATRVVYHLVHRNSDDQWHLSVVGADDDVAAFASKEEARQDGERRGRQHVNRGELAQLVVHRQDGSIETEFTYGADPRETQG
jgi:DNA-binding transcriptional regulator PaaX